MGSSKGRGLVIKLLVFTAHARREAKEALMKS